MKADSDSREFRLEGLGLFVVGGVLLAAMGGAFFLGRWVERRSTPPPALAAGGSDPLAGVVERAPDADVADSLTFFDDVTTGDKELEPGREIALPATDRPAERRPSEPVAATATKTPAATGGSFFVQVFAGRDRKAAEMLVDKLQGQGRAVRLFTEREGRGSLFKVRVGGYPTQDAARLAAVDLQKAGYAGAWVTEAK